MLEANRHSNIEILSYSEVVKVDGYIGNFKVKVKKNPRFVVESACTGCGACTDACPIYVSNYFDEHLSARKCIDIAFAQAVPAIYDIDREHCVECFGCVDACTEDAIDFSQQELFVRGNQGDPVKVKPSEFFTHHSARAGSNRSAFSPCSPR